MNFDEFRQASKRTMRFTPEHRANAALGLVGELGEFFSANSTQGKLEEAGDAMFYLAWLCEFYNITLQSSPIDDRDDLFHYAAEVADMVKKHAFHGKVPNTERMTICLSNIHDWFEVVYERELSNIYQANIAKLLLRHPIEKGYTNEGQNMRADEIIKQCNPCACIFPDKSTITYVMYRNNTHRINCTRCGFDACDKDLAMAIEKWNSINIDAPVAEPIKQVSAAPCGNCETTVYLMVSSINDYIRCNKCGVKVEDVPYQGYNNALYEKWNARQARDLHGQ